MPREKILTNIYRIDTESFDDDTGVDTIIDQIVSAYNEKLRKKSNASGFNAGEYIKQKINNSFRSDIFNVKTYGAITDSEPGWREFISAVVDRSSDIQVNKNKYVSYVTYIYNNENVYAVCGGLGSHVVQEYIDENFGIEVVTRLIHPDSNVVKSFQEKALTGSIMAATKYFRRDSKLTDEDDFGKIYNQICAELDKNILIDKLGFDGNEVTKDAGCNSKASFQLQRSIAFSRLLILIEKIEELLQEEPKLILNRVKLISKRVKKNKQLINDLEDALFERLFMSILDEATIVDFELCHPEHEKYLNADQYNIYKGSSAYSINDGPLDELNDINKLLAILVREDSVSKSSEIIFSNDVKKIRIESITEDIPYNKTSGYMLRHLHGEIEYNGKTYFHMDGKWYEINADYIENLNNEFSVIIENHRDESILPKDWNHVRESENQYNQKYLSELEYYVLDKFTAEYIEVCDILHVNDEECVLIHVKRGFNNTTRDLTSQIAISARRIHEDINASTSYEYLRGYYRSIVKGKSSSNEYRRNVANQFQGVNEEDFIDIFRKKKISYCLAFQDSRDITLDPKQYKSNIAKFSVLESKRLMTSYLFGFKIAQIESSL